MTTKAFHSLLGPLAIIFMIFVSGPAARAQDLFGVVGHFLHNDRFYPQYGSNWRVERTLPIVKELGIFTVHEAIYALEDPRRALVSAGRTDPAFLAQLKANRAQVSEWLSEYDRSGVSIVMAVLAQVPKNPKAEQNNAEFFEWIADVVARHRSIVAVQMHNEANLRHFWTGTPEQYVDTYRVLAELIKAKRPEVRILVGGMSSLWWGPGISWMNRAVQRGVLEFADGIATHPYNNDNTPEIDPHWRGAPISDPDHREKALLAFWKQVETWNTGKRKLELFFTEFGWNTATKGIAHVDEATQADFLARSFLIFHDVRLKGVPLRSAHWYDLKDDGLKDDNPQHRFGLISYDLQRRKPAFFAFKAMSRFFGDSNDFELSKARISATSSAPIKLKSWRRKSDGAEIIVFWSTGMDGSPGQSAPAKLVLEGTSVRSARVHFASEQPAKTLSVKTQGGSKEIDIEISARPGWVELLTR